MKELPINAEPILATGNTPSPFSSKSNMILAFYKEDLPAPDLAYIKTDLCPKIRDNISSDSSYLPKNQSLSSFKKL